MTRLLLIKHETAEAAKSPELRYLTSCCADEAARVFDHVRTVLWRPGCDTFTAPEKDEALLVLGRESVYLGHQSLEAMRRAMVDGAAVVLPRALSTFDLAEEELPHTLRGFERLEERLLSGTGADGSRTSHLPLALFSPQLGSHLEREFGADGLLVDEELLAKLDDPAPRSKGIYHEYIDYYGELREDILELLPNRCRTVLEIGCGRGRTGAFLEERLGCRVTGIELNPEVARDAESRLSRVIVGDIRELELDRTYDAILATELFEHLDDPMEFLHKAKAAIVPGGRLVLSVPNVGHWSIAEDLLAGRWDYLPVGLLCYTHLRFFTRTTLERWIRLSGFSSSLVLPQRSSSLPQRFERLTEEWELDTDSLATRGFYVLLQA